MVPELDLLLAVQVTLGIELGCGFDLFLRQVDVHPCLSPVDLIDPLGGDEDVTSGELVPRIHQGIANDPRPWFQVEILKVTDLAVARLDVIAQDFPGTAQVWIGLTTLLGLCGSVDVCCHGRRHPDVPVGSPAGVGVELFLHLARDGLFQVDLGAPLDLFLG